MLIIGSTFKNYILNVMKNVDEYQIIILDTKNRSQEDIIDAIAFIEEAREKVTMLHLHEFGDLVNDGGLYVNGESAGDCLNAFVNHFVLTNGFHMEVIHSHPLYKHDCNECIFLGRFNQKDLYFCDQNKTLPTILVRHSSKDSDYTSGLEFGANAAKDSESPVGEAYRRAKRRKLV